MNPRTIGCLLFVALAPCLPAQTAWNVGRTNLPGVNFAQSVAFGNGRFVVTLSGPAGAPGLAWSVDGLTWRPAATEAGVQGTVVFAGGMFYHAGHAGVSRSADGDTWERIHSPASITFLRGMATNGHGLLICNPNINAKTLLYSPDFTTFRQTAPVPHSDIAGIQMHYGDLAYAFGRYYLAYAVSGPSTGGSLAIYVASTIDGSEWTLATGPLGSARRLAAGNGRLVGLVSASTGTTTVSSTDGVTFSSAPVPAGATNGGSMVFAGGRFFFAGSLLSSFDARTWVPLAPVTFPGGGQMTSMAYGNGRYVAVGYRQGMDVIASLPATAPPVVATAPTDRTVAEGARVTLAVTLENPGIGTTFQWRRNDAPIASATAATLTLDGVRFADAGSYSAEIRNAVGVTTTEPMQLTVLPAAAAGRIVNVSVLTSIDEASGPDSAFTVGFVVGGAGTQGNKPLLVRAGGPALARFGVATPNADPRLELFSGAQRTAENDNWGGSGTLAEVTSRVGAFAFDAADSKDAAVFSDNIPQGPNSVMVFGVGGATGAVIAEVYDATPAGAYGAATPRLINVSVLKSIRDGATLNAGFVIGGSTSRSVVIRVVGPSLGMFGVTAPLSDPRAAVYRGGASAPFATNDGWGGTAQLTAAFGSVGAFSLPPSSLDAALLLTLEPGNYVVQASGSSGSSSGPVLIEIYELHE